MVTTESNNPVTRAERMELARCANVQIAGMSGELLRMIRAQDTITEAPKYHAALGMLATIHDLSDEIYGLIFGDPNDEFTREQADRIMRKLGLDCIDVHPDLAEVHHA